MKKAKGFLWRRKWLVLAAVLVVGGGFFIVRANAASKKTETKTAHPIVQTIRQTVQVSGDVDATEKANLHFVTASRLSWVGVKEGEWVKKWQAIASVDTQAMKKQLQQSVNAYVSKARDYTTDWDSYEKAKDPDIIETIRPFLEGQKFDLDRKVLYSLDDAALNVEIQQLAIRLSSLVSPLDGIVTRLDQPLAGVNVMPTDTFQVVNPQSVYFAAIVDETDLAKVFVGQKATITMDAYPDETLEAAVTRIDFSPSTTRSGGNGYKISITFPVDNSQMKYRLGMGGTVTLLVQEKATVLTIPVDAIVSRDGGTFVDTLELEKTVQKPVSLGIQTDELAEVTSGLSETDTIVMPK